MMMAAASAVPSPAEVILLPKCRLREASRLLHRTLGYGELETPPAWLMHTTTLHGGVTLGALQGDRMVGVLYALPARLAEGDWCLHVCAVAVAESQRSRGIAGRLMKASHRAARSLGYPELRWTTGVLNTRAHLLYLRHCRASLVAYRPQLYAHLLQSLGDPPRVADEVEFRWATNVLPPAASAPSLADDEMITLTAEVSPGVRAIVGTREPPGAGRRVLEIPWAARALDDRGAAHWRVELRRLVPDLLDRGYEGVDALADPVGRRAFIVFDMPRSSGS